MLRAIAGTFHGTAHNGRGWRPVSCLQGGRRLILCALLLIGLAPGADLQLPPKFRGVVDLVGNAPPEFGSSALLDLLDSGRISDGPTRGALIERAFQLAGQAHERWHLLPLAVEYNRAASALRLDQLSLESRAVKLMLGLDKRRARQLFLEIPKPAPPPLACSDSGEADLSDYYTVLGLVVDQTFTPDERRNEDHVHFLADYLGTIVSPVQFLPALQMVRTLSVTNPQRHLLLEQLGSAMNGISADDRSFAAVSSGLGRNLPPELSAAFQHYLASHASAEVCGAPRPAAGPSEEERRFEREALQVVYRGDLRTTAAEQGTAEFRDRLEDFLAKVNDWRQGPDESDVAFYRQKMSVYGNLIDATLPPLRARVIDDMLRFALSSPLERDSPAEWFQALKSAKDRVRHGLTPGPDVIDGFVRTGDPVLLLDAALERALAR